jgi:hypothetical protein
VQRKHMTEGAGGGGLAKRKVKRGQLQLLLYNRTRLSTKFCAENQSVWAARGVEMVVCAFQAPLVTDCTARMAEGAGGGGLANEKYLDSFYRIA